MIINTLRITLAVRYYNLGVDLHYFMDNYSTNIPNGKSSKSRDTIII